MRKKILSITLVTLIIVSSISVSQFSAFSKSKDDYSYETLDDNTVKITKYSGDDKNLEIPDQLNGLKVSEIGENSFEYCNSLYSVTIPDGVTNIDDYAFNECVHLESVNFSNTISSIGKAAFFSCTRLQAVSLPNSLKFIGDGAFYNCENLTDAKICGNIESIGEYVFGKCAKLNNVLLDCKLNEVGNLMFLGCTSLTKVEIPNGTKIIGRKAFMDCNELCELSIPDSVEVFGEKAFGYTALSSINFPTNLTTIDDYAFTGTSIDKAEIQKSTTNISSQAFATSNIMKYSIDSENPEYTLVDDILFSKDMTKIISYPALKDDVSSYTIPDSVTEIGSYCFSNCYALTEIIIGNNITKIGDYSFSYSGLESIDIPNSVTSLGEGAFDNCNAITKTTVPNSIEEIKPFTFNNCGNLTELNISEGVKIIDENAFNTCPMLNSITLPSTIVKINNNAFVLCSTIEAINVSSSNPYFKSFDGILFNKDMTELVIYPAYKSGETYTIPNSVSKISDNAFLSCHHLKSVTVPETVTTLGKYSLGYYNLFDNSGVTGADNFIIYGKTGSSAENYAKENSVPFFTGTPSQNAESVSLKQNETFKFEITNTNANNTIFSSSNSTVAEIDSNGIIKGISKGKTTVIAAIGNKYYICNVEVTSGEAKADSKLSQYKKVTYPDCEEWESKYYSQNTNLSFEHIDNPSIHCYSGNEYIPIVAVQSGGKYLEQTKLIYGNDYKQYEIISKNLSQELGNFELSENTVLYSGTNDVSEFTGKSSSLADMISSVGKTVTSQEVISTSIDHGVANGFGSGKDHTVLEIYAPKSETRGGYIKKFSQYPNEYELLLDKGIKFKVIGAGVRNATFTDFTTTETINTTERYLQLEIVSTKPDEPVTSPTQEYTQPEQTAPSQAQVIETTATNPTVPETTVANNNDKNSVATGENNLAVIFNILLFICLSALIVLAFKRKSH